MTKSTQSLGKQCMTAARACTIRKQLATVLTQLVIRTLADQNLFDGDDSRRVPRATLTTTMVYRGKPSAGCEQCRNAKKSCTLERPACSRCVKLKKVCEGYRDVDAMKFRNESQAIIRKARKAAQRHEASKESDLENSSSGLATLISPSDTKESTTCLQHTSRDGSVGMALSDTHKAGTLSLIETSPELISMSYVLPLGIIPRGNDIAKGYFFKQFTSDRHWNFLENESELNKDSCLDLAIRACGMAALDNIRPIPNGRTWSRQIYANALSKLNAALCDPVAVKRDQSLIAVAVLSYYEVRMQIGGVFSSADRTNRILHATAGNQYNRGKHTSTGQQKSSG